MDRYMVFDKYLDEVCRKTMGILMFLNRIKENFVIDVRIMIVQALALSQLNYCSKIWGSANKSQKQRAQKLQNFAAKIAVGKAKKYDHATPYINRLGWLKMEQKCAFDICTFVYRILEENISSWLLEPIRVGDINLRNTRQVNNLVIPRTSTNTCAKCIMVRGPAI